LSDHRRPTDRLRAGRSWSEAEPDEYERSAFYAACKTDKGIVILSG
jgi:hypothetical protein